MSHETNRIEYKRELTEGLEKEVVAFLNYHEGGVIFIGVDNQGIALGVADLDGDMLKIKDRLKNNILPSCMGLFDISAIEREGKNIIKITLASGPEKPYYIKQYGMAPKGCYIRVGTAAEPMPLPMIDNLFAKRTRNSISKIKSPQQQLNFEQLKIYYEAKGNTLNKQFATNLELLTENGDYNYVAFLMTDSNSVSIKFAKYNGVSRSALIESPDFGYESLVKATKQMLDKFELFRDRIEITSSGGLPHGLSKEEFFEGYSVPRNKEIMRIFKDLGLVEQLGTGVPTILESYGKECFKFSDNFIRMTFPISNQVTDQAVENTGDVVGGQTGGQIASITTKQREVFELILANPKISRKELSVKLGINESAVQKHLKVLIETKIIERVGTFKGYWNIIRE